MVLGRLAFVCVVLHGGRLFAAEPGPTAPRPPEPDRVRISFSAPASCPDKASFMAQIAGRVTIPWLADETELARHIRVTLEPSPTGFGGRMEYVDESGRTVTRSLDAPDCAQATAGIALVTAIAVESQAAQPVPLDALARTEPASTRAGSETKDPGAAQPDNANQVSPATAKPIPIARAPSTNPGARDREHRVETPGAGTVRHEAGVLGGGMQGVGPSIAFGGALFWGFGKEPFPWLRAIARWYETRDEADASGAVTAHFRLIAVGPQACIGGVLVGPVTQAVCAGIEVGQYLAEGEAPDSAPYVARPPHRLFWAAAEAALPLRLAGRSVFVELEPAVRFPLVSGAFELRNPDDSVYEIPRVAIGLNLATGITFR